MEKEYYRFYKELGEKYPEEEIVYKTLRGRLRRKFIIQYVHSWKGSLLDIGCNRGIYLAEYNDKCAVGIDISFHALRKAANRSKKNNAIYFVLGDAEELSFIKNETFDHILCSELLEHVYNPGKVIDAITRILKPGGTVLITAPNYSKKRPAWIDTGSLALYNIKGVHNNKYYHTAFKPEEIARMTHSRKLRVLKKGTLEKEIRYATKIPVVFHFLFKMINKSLMRSTRFKHWNDMFLDRFSKGVYYAARFLHLDALLTNLFREGVRTYVLAQKGGNS